MSPHFSFVDNPLPALPSRVARALTALHVHVRYARLLLWPHTLSADYSYDCVPAVTQPFDARNLGAFALYAGLAWLAGGAFVAARRPMVSYRAERATVARKPPAADAADNADTAGDAVSEAASARSSDERWRACGRSSSSATKRMRSVGVS